MHHPPQARSEAARERRALRPSPAALLGLLGLVAAGPAAAVLQGEVVRDPDGVRGSVVRVENSRGELCSGALIAPDQVLTAAHCVLESTSYRVVGVDRAFRPRSVTAVAAALHPEFVPGTTPRTQPGVDLAILKLAEPFGADFTPLDPRAAGTLGRGQPVALAGFGVSAERQNRTARVLRETRMVSLGTLEVANRVAVVVDERRLAESAGTGACRGDSGGPIFAGGPGRYQLLGIISWSSGALNVKDRSACGGLTAVTPVGEHLGWIQARSADLARLQVGRVPVAVAGRSNKADWVR